MEAADVSSLGTRPVRGMQGVQELFEVKWNVLPSAG